MYRDISIGGNQNYILMKEKAKQSPWTLMEFEKEEDVLSKSITTGHDCVVIKDERVLYEDFIQFIAQTVEEIGDGERDMMLCLYQHNRWIPEKISKGTSESHVFETDYWCMFAGIEESEDR